MKRLLVALPIAALVLAAADSVGVRRAYPYRPTDPHLYLQAALLWLAFGCAALLPAWATLRLLERRRRRRGAGAEGARLGPVEAGVLLLAWTVLPVVLHGALDAFTGVGGDVSGLARPLPWLAAAAAAGALALVSAAAARLLGRLPGRRAALAALALAVPTGLFLPVREEEWPVIGPADASGRPNVLLLVLDTCRRDRLLPYGYDRETTPALARFAEEALVFEDARSVACFTFTSHLSMLTGVLPSSHGARLLDSRYDPRRAATAPEAFRDAGYRTGAFVGTDVLSGRTGIRHGFGVYDDVVDPRVCDTQAWELVHDVQALLAGLHPRFAQNGQPHWFQDFQRPASEVLSRALAWIRQDDERPWFCMVNVYDVHWPYLPGPESAAAIVRDYHGPLDGYLFRSDRWVEGTPIGDADRRHVSDLYDAELRDLDRELDRFLDALDLGSGRTAVLVTSDHGEAFGEAGTWMHDHVFEPQLRIPFLLRLPGPEPERGTVPGRVSGIDVAPTLLALAGLEPPPGMEGIDLTAAPPPPRRVVRVEDRDHLDPDDVRVAVYRGPWKLVRRGLGDEARYTLHDLRTDPIGEIDVQAEHPDALAELVPLLESWRAEADAREAGAEARLRGRAAALRALGYFGGE